MHAGIYGSFHCIGFLDHKLLRGQRLFCMLLHSGMTLSLTWERLILFPRRCLVAPEGWPHADKTWPLSSIKAL